ncbi:hypothetical protein OSTOST_10012 [Ostertagia ostertagi]
MSEGRHRLSEYNKNNGTSICMLKELTMRASDENNLGLLIRKKLTSIYNSNSVKVPDMRVRKGFLSIGKNLTIRSSLAFVKFGLTLPEWKGVPIEELLDDEEKADLKVR